MNDDDRAESCVAEHEAVDDAGMQVHCAKARVAIANRNKSDEYYFRIKYWTQRLWTTLSQNKFDVVSRG